MRHLPGLREATEGGTVDHGLGFGGVTAKVEREESGRRGEHGPKSAKGRTQQNKHHGNMADHDKCMCLVRPCCPALTGVREVYAAVMGNDPPQVSGPSVVPAMQPDI